MKIEVCCFELIGKCFDFARHNKHFPYVCDILFSIWSKYSYGLFSTFYCFIQFMASEEDEIPWNIELITKILKGV